MIHLRALEPEDLDLLYSIENQPENWCVGTPAGPYSRYALKQYLSMQPSHLCESGYLRLVICSNERSVGLIDLMEYSPTDRRAEVGIALLDIERGKGIARQALKVLEEYAYDVLNLRMLYAKVSVYGNSAAWKLFSSAGYQQVATLPSWHYVLGEYEDLAVMQKIIARVAKTT